MAVFPTREQEERLLRGACSRLYRAASLGISRAARDLLVDTTAVLGPGEAAEFSADSSVLASAGSSNLVASQARPILRGCSSSERTHPRTIRLPFSDCRAMLSLTEMPLFTATRMPCLGLTRCAYGDH
eukprot:1197187-Rhodomonas_salina.1